MMSGLSFLFLTSLICPIIIVVPKRIKGLSIVVASGFLILQLLYPETGNEMRAMKEPTQKGERESQAIIPSLRIHSYVYCICIPMYVCMYVCMYVNGISRTKKICKVGKR
jgi:hypothetical protein